MARSGDGTKVIFSNDVEPSELFLYDSATDSFVTASVPFFAFSVAANANGTQFSVASDKICVFDAQLNVLSTLPGSAPLQYSPDGSKLYLVGFLGSVPVVQTFDSQPTPSSARLRLDLISRFSTGPQFIQELPLVADETGRLFGAADHGLAIDDPTDYASYPAVDISGDSFDRHGIAEDADRNRYKKSGLPEDILPASCSYLCCPISPVPCIFLDQLVPSYSIPVACVSSGSRWVMPDPGCFGPPATEIHCSL